MISGEDCLVDSDEDVPDPSKHVNQSSVPGISNQLDHSSDLSGTKGTLNVHCWQQFDIW